ncbi:hypothetical protein C8Q72DRAFT_803913 [Fomitopsis betulina]|nr:hypothetical protein C8Q72DRAFT_803913 [Fomitopsis betulina]
MGFSELTLTCSFALSLSALCSVSATTTGPFVHSCVLRREYYLSTASVNGDGRSALIGLDEGARPSYQRTDYS